MSSSFESWGKLTMVVVVVITVDCEDDAELVAGVEAMGCIGVDVKGTEVDKTDLVCVDTPVDCECSGWVPENLWANAESSESPNKLERVACSKLNGVELVLNVSRIDSC